MRRRGAGSIATQAAAFLIAATLVIAPALAQKVTGVVGSPSATTTEQGNQLPSAPAKFGGVIKQSAKDSKPWWPPRVVPPKGAPNILLIMTDDQGYGVSGTFGGVIPTPALDRIAKAGLRYTEFNSTSLCSPTRAALITGRNHHSTGFGVISELSTGFPGYDSILGPETATIGTILRDNGYATSWFGKNHNTPAFQLSVAGPFNQWPVGMGFEYFYGFMGGETDQWTPYLFKNTTQIFPWVGKPGYNLTTDMADEAISYMNQLNAVSKDQPFFVYYVPGGSHSPHNPKKEWVEKFKGKFDKGWNAMRDEIFANQKQLGVIPADAKLTPWPDELKKWDALTPDEKKLFARQAEVYAGYTAYTDHEIGRVIQAVEDMGNYSQADDLAAKMPDKLKQMQALFEREAKKYNVYPLNNSSFARAIMPRPSTTAGQTSFTYSGVLPGLAVGNSPDILNKSYTITARVQVPQGGGDGMIVTEGGRWGGYGLYLLKGKPVFDYNALMLKQFRWEGKEPLTAGTHTIVFDFKYDGPGPGKGGTGDLRVDGKQVATLKVEHTIPFLMPADETFDVGVDTRTGVNDKDYQVPFRFNGTIEKLTFNLGPDQLAAEDRQKMQEATAKAHD